MTKDQKLAQYETLADDLQRYRRGLQCALFETPSWSASYEDGDTRVKLRLFSPDSPSGGFVLVIRSEVGPDGKLRNQEVEPEFFEALHRRAMAERLTESQRKFSDAIDLMYQWRLDLLRAMRASQQAVSRRVAS